MREIYELIGNGGLRLVAMDICRNDLSQTLIFRPLSLWVESIQLYKIYIFLQTVISVAWSQE